jgi:hypothetical protein
MKIKGSLKDELIKRLMSTVYKDDFDELKEKDLEYLNLLSVDKLDEMLRDYQLNKPCK